MKKHFYYIIILLLSLITAYTLSLDINDYENFSYYYNNSLMPIILFIFTFILIKKTYPNANDRLKLISSTISFILAIIMVIGNCLYCNLNLSDILFNKIFFIKSLLYFITTLVISNIIIINIYPFLDEIKSTNYHFKDSKYTYLLIWIIIFLAWMPYFLSWYPGVVTPDPIVQIEQILGLRELTNNHPIIHTMLIKLCMVISSPFGNYTLAVAIYSIIQMLILSLIFTITIKWMIENNFNCIIIVLALIFYAIYPVNAIYSFTMWKDIIYSGLILIFTLITYNIIENKKYLLKFKNYIIFLLVMIAIMLFRNNGFLVVIPVLLILMIKLKENRQNLSKSLIILITFLLIWVVSLNYIFKISTTSTIDAFSIPLQQVARIYIKKYNNLTTYERKTIQKYLNEENEDVKDYYNPLVSDNVKNHFNLDTFKEDKITFITLWIRLIFKYPITSTEAFLYNNYGYWYPRAQHWVISYGIIETEKDWQLASGPIEKPLISAVFINKVWESIDNRQRPFIPMLYSIGFMTWIILILITYTIYKKEIKTFLAYTPVILVFANCLLSPVWAEFRYYYPIVICIPVILAISTKKHKI